MRQREAHRRAAARLRSTRESHRRAPRRALAQSSVPVPTLAMPVPCGTDRTRARFRRPTSRCRCRARRRQSPPPADRRRCTSHRASADGVCRRAFASRLLSTSRMRTGSTAIGGRCSGRGNRRVSRPVRRLRLRRRERRRAPARRHRSAPSAASARRPRTARAVRRSSISRDRTWVSSSKLAELTIVTRIDAVEESFEPALNHRQRRAQLVRDIGHQVAAQAIVVLQPLGHRVERARERAHRRRPVLARRARRSRRQRRDRRPPSRLPSGRADASHAAGQRRAHDGRHGAKQHGERHHGARRAAGGQVRTAAAPASQRANVTP